MGWIEKLIKVLAIAMSVFQIYTAMFGVLPAMEQRGLHLLFGAALVFLLSTQNRKNKLHTVIDLLFVVLSLIATLYSVLLWKEMLMRIAFPLPIDLFMGTLTILIVLEITRRTIGWPLPFIAICFIIYAKFGNLLPGAIGHKGYDWERIISHLWMSTEGIYGPILGVSATFVFMFILFGVMLNGSGAGDGFIKIATSIFGRFRGGPAKVVVVSSGFMGSISGSAIANVVGTGSFTIPMMKRLGYKPNFAGAVETVASTGGQFMPPIMGAAAFLMTEVLGVPYSEIVLAALIPGILFYLTLIFVVDFEAARLGLVGLSKNELPNLKETLLKYWIFLIPLGLLMYFLIGLKWSTMQSGLWATISIPLLTLFHKEFRMGIKKLMDVLEQAAKSSLEVVAVCACAGIVVGMVSLTGLGLKFSGLLVDLSMGYLPLLLLLTAIACIILGMGLTGTSVYVILSVLAAPALVDLGVNKLAAHLFVYYFGILAVMTPPVAPAAFVAAGIAKGDPVATGFLSFKLGIAAYIIPFIFVYRNGLIMHGSPLEIVVTTVLSMMAVIAAAAGLHGWLAKECHWFERVLLIASSVGFLIMSTPINLGAFLLVMFVLAKQIIEIKFSRSKSLAG